MEVDLFTFSSIDLVNQCLIDNERIESYNIGIQSAVKNKESIVLDIGTGCGVLAMLAARAGAKKVYALEVDSYLANITKQIIKHNKLDGIIEVINDDARSFNLKNYGLDTKLNVVTMDLLTTGLIDEYQVAAVNNLHVTGVVDDATVFVPFQQTTEVQLVNVDFTRYGLEFPMVMHVWKQFSNVNPKVEPITEWCLLNNIEYNVVHPLNFKENVKFVANQSKVVNAIFLRSQTWSTRKEFISDTIALNAPVIVPIRPREVHKNENLVLEVSYIFGEGYSSLKASLL